MKITKLVPTEVEIKLPVVTIKNSNDNDPHTCLLNETAFTQNCDCINCCECYFSLSVFKVMADVSD